MTKIEQSRTEVRSMRRTDLRALQAVLDGTELFPSDRLPDMIESFLGDEPADLWLTATLDGEPVGLCFAAPEQLAHGTWNMLALAVLPAHQGGGLGARMTERLEAELKARGGVRILIVDTSGCDDFVLAREFYAKQGYELEARIRDYWADGDDKMTFRKPLI